MFVGHNPQQPGLVHQVRHTLLDGLGCYAVNIGGNTGQRGARIDDRTASLLASDMVAVAIAVSCWLMAYRRRPKSVGPLPHPAEFPNPLFTTPTPPLQEPAPDYLS